MHDNASLNKTIQANTKTKTRKRQDQDQDQDKAWHDFQIR